MPLPIDLMWYVKSPVQPAYELKDAYSWGAFIRYIEFGDDAFANRQVDEYENGYLTRYDRVHWDDQFGTLATFRFGDRWIQHWGEPNRISTEEFEEKWIAAQESPPFGMRISGSEAQPPWIELHESKRGKP